MDAGAWYTLWSGVASVGRSLSDFTLIVPFKRPLREESARLFVAQIFDFFGTSLRRKRPGTFFPNYFYYLSVWILWSYIVREVSLVSLRKSG